LEKLKPALLEEEIFLFANLEGDNPLQFGKKPSPNYMKYLSQLINPNIRGRHNQVEANHT